MNRIVAIFLAGLITLLPILVTVIVTVWAGSFVRSYVGPDSLVGGWITALGLNLATSPTAAYLLGVLIILGCIFVLGLVVETRLRSWVQGGLDRLVSRIPLVSNIYDLSKRFVAIVDRTGGEEDSLKSMSPVWCFFGGEGGAAVLGLMPSPQPVVIGKDDYLAILVPSAPVPIGGGLIYVPAAWIRPAEGGVERLMNVYVSMGVTPPHGLPAERPEPPAALGAPPRGPKP